MSEIEGKTMGKLGGTLKEIKSKAEMKTRVLKNIKISEEDLKDMLN